MRERAVPVFTGLQLNVSSRTRVVVLAAFPRVALGCGA